MNLSSSHSFLLGLVIWAALFPVMIVARRAFRVPGAGLDLAYLATFFMGHAPGAFLYLLPWYFTLYDGVAVGRGFELSWIGALVFCVAWMVGLPLVRTALPKVSVAAPNAELDDERLPWLLFTLGVISYLVFLPVAGRVASLTSIVANLANLQVVGIVLGVWQGLRVGSNRRVILWLALSPILPFLTLTAGGFLGFGIAALVPLSFFVLSRVRFHWWYSLIAVAGIYLGISLFITYMDARGEIRAVVWGNEEYSERVEVVRTEFSEWQWFDWRNQDHLSLIDSRLNQNFLVGVARINLESGIVRYAEGATLQRAILAFIPRAIWRDKPQVAGGADMVTNYTLIQFAEGTSVAAGQVMEFYINFAFTGVIFGFAILGLLFALLDSLAAWHLANRNLYGFLRFYLIGLALLKPTDDLTVLTAGAASAVVTMLLLEFALRRWFARLPHTGYSPALPPAPALVPPQR